MHLDLDKFVGLIKSTDAFAFSRWGDGEFNCLLGVKGENCDGVRYTPELRRDLLRVLTDYKNAHALNYYFGFLEISREIHKDNLRAFMLDYPLVVRWSEGDFLHQANRTGKLFPLIEALRSKDVLYVGPNHLRLLDSNNIVRINTFVEVPAIGAYDEISRIKKDVLNKTKPNQLIGVSMGIGAKVLIHDLYYSIGSDHQIIDFGSVFDGYVGVFSRKYFSRKEWMTYVKMNVGIKDA